MSDPLVEVKNLSVGFTSRAGVTLPILRNIDLTFGKGETIGLVGESGCGKSTLALAMMGYLKTGLRVLEGESLFRGRNVFEMDEGSLEGIRGGDLALIPQNAGQSLTPTSRVGQQIKESVRLHTKLTKEQWRDRTIELFSQVRLPQPEVLLERYPHELSGGQQQRVAIAMALAGNLTSCCSMSRQRVSTSPLRPISSSCCAIWRPRPEPQWSMSAMTWGPSRGSVTVLPSCMRENSCSRVRRAAC
jgi:peptide/nickel transport system ATP-binding protein